MAVLCGATELHAQRVHLLVAGDTKDPNIGKGVDHDLGNVVVAFFILLREGQLEHDRVAGDDVSAANILKAIDGIRVKPDETLVFYWAGHGASDEQGHYLQMPHGGNLYRSTLLGAMKKKQARLTVLLTDCCNVYTDSKAGLPPVSPSSPDPRRKTSPLMEELLLKPRGVVDINAASQGEVALGTQEGGLFTLSLVYMFPLQQAGGDPNFGGGLEDAFGVFWRNSQKRISWQQIVEQSRKQVQKLFEQMNPDGLVGRDGQVFHNQTVAAFTLPEEPKLQQDRGSRFGVEAVDNGSEGVRVVRVWPNYPGTQTTEVGGNKLVPLQPGDVILTINGRKISNKKDYWDAVKSSPVTMEFTIRDARDGATRKMRAQLRY
jgi:hypothetical protein